MLAEGSVAIVVLELFLFGFRSYKTVLVDFDVVNAWQNWLRIILADPRALVV